MEIRESTIGDIDKMKEVLRDAFHDTYAGAGEFYSSSQLVDPNYSSGAGPYYDIKSFLEDNLTNIENHLKEPFKSFVAVENNEIVGYLIVEMHKGKLWINDVVVRRDYQKGGVGKKLFEIATKNQDNVYIWVNSKNPALNFWRKLGFGEVLEEKLMVKKIKKIKL